MGLMFKKTNYSVYCTLQYVCLLLLTFCVIKISLSPCKEERGGEEEVSVSCWCQPHAS